MVSNNEISSQEKELIIQLRNRVRNEIPLSERSEEDQDLFLVRWIRARDNNLDKATDMLRNSLNWRKERNADKALETEFHPFYAKNYPLAFPGLDKFGHPVMILPLAEWDFRKIGNDEDLLKEYENFNTRLYELIMNEIQKAHASRPVGHPPITQFLCILDVKDYPYGQILNFAALKKLIHGASTYEAYYPEILFRCIYINCPSYFGMLINLMKPFFATRTLEKFFFYSSVEEWKKEVSDITDPAILPERYGGITKNSD